MATVLLSAQGKVAGTPSICLTMMIDTGADVTCLPHSIWPRDWPTERGLPLAGVGGQSASRRSALAIAITLLDEPDLPPASSRPYLVSTPMPPVLGRDVLRQWGLLLSIEPEQPFRKRPL